MSFGPEFTAFVRHFGFTGVRAAGIVAGLRRTGADALQAHEIARLREFADQVRRGVPLTAAEYDEAASLLRRVAPRYTARMLLTQARDGFRVQAVEDLYRADTAGMAEPPSRVQWMRDLSDGSPAAVLLRKLCGEDFRAQAVSRIGMRAPPIQINSVAGSPRQAGTVRKRLVRDVIDVPGASRNLFDRLGRLFDTQHGAMAPQQLALGTVGRAHFSILKGNVAELLARDLVLAAMREGGGFQHALPAGSVLVTGARVRLGDGGAMLFSDGLIGAIVDGRWQWHGVVEVKAYDSGFGDAAEQVVRWRDISALESPFTLEFSSRGATVIGIDGSEIAQSVDLRFPYAPGAPDNRIELPPAGDGLLQILVAPQGASRFDLADTRSELSGRVHNITHTYTNQELDYYTALILQEASGLASVEQALSRLDFVGGRSEPLLTPAP